MFKAFTSALFKKDKGFTPLEIQRSLSSFKGFKAKPPNGLTLSTIKFNGKFLTGFTLIELMVVMTIISIITAVVLADYRAGGQQLALDRSANKLAQDIRRAQEMAMSATECPAGTGCAGQIPPRYGIYIASPLDDSGNPTSTNSYILFADTVSIPNGEYCFTNMGPPGDWDTIIEDNMLFEDDVYLTDVGWDGCSGRNNEHRRSHLVFSPPDPENKLSIGTCGHPTHHPVECSEIYLTLGIENSSQTKTVTINSAGLIYVE